MSSKQSGSSSKTAEDKSTRNNKPSSSSKTAEDKSTRNNKPSGSSSKTAEDKSTRKAHGSKSSITHKAKHIQFAYYLSSTPDVKETAERVIDAWLEHRCKSDGTFKGAIDADYKPYAGLILQGGRNHQTPRNTPDGIKVEVDLKDHITVLMISQADIKRPTMMGCTVHIYTKKTPKGKDEIIEYDDRSKDSWVSVIKTLPSVYQEAIKRHIDVGRITLDAKRTPSPEAKQVDKTAFTDALAPQKSAWGSGKSTVAGITNQLQRTQVAEQFPAVATGTADKSKGKGKGKGVATDTSDSRYRSQTQAKQGSASRDKPRSRSPDQTRSKGKYIGQLFDGKYMYSHYQKDGIDRYYTEKGEDRTDRAKKYLAEKAEKK